MSSKVTICVVLVAVALVGLPLANKLKQRNAGQLATANLTPEQRRQVELIKIPDQNSPVDISPDQLTRMKLMKFLGPNASLTILPVRIWGKEVDAASASDLVKMINDAGVCKAVPAKQSLLLKASLNDPNEMNKLMDMAREFGGYVKQNPPDTDYVLYADYLFTPDYWDRGMVHFVICDRQGEWVILDLQNSDHPDYQSIKPTSKEGCSKLLVKRLASWLR